MSDLTLYQIDETLAQLLMYREEREADTQDPMTDDEREVVNSEIVKYLHAELPRKVESFTALVRKWRATASIAKAEAKRYREIAERMEAQEKRLLGLAAEVLEKQPEPKKGCKKLIGADGSMLMLKGNGGIQPLAIPVPEMLPIDYFDVTVRMSQSQWEYIALLAADSTMLDQAEVLSTEPSNKRIRAVLAQPCIACKGDAAFSEDRPEDKRCAECGGTGKQGVPGASLLPRSNHVEVK